MNRTVCRVLLGGFCLLASLGLWGGLQPGRAADTPSVELMHLWLDPIEAPAVGVLRSAIQSNGLTLREHRVEGNFYGIRMAFAERLAMQVPPDAVFWIGGQALNEMVGNGTFRRLRGIPGLQQFTASLHPTIRAALTSEDGLSALPLGVHLQNYIVLNKAVYRKAGAPLPETWSEFIESAPALKRIGIVPLSMSGQRWQLRFLFAAIMAEQMGLEIFNEFLRMTDPAKANPAVRHALVESLRLLDQLHGLTNQDFTDLDWGSVVNRVKSGSAAAVVLGDFMTPTFDDENDFACGLSLGNRFLMWSGDVIAFPKMADATRTLNQDRVITALTQPKQLHRYIEKKGGVPVTLDTASGEFNSCTQAGIVLWQSSIPKIHLDANDWSNRLNLLSAFIETFWARRDKSVEEMADLMLRATIQLSPRNTSVNPDRK